jgi:hypothetical protein
MGLHFGCFPWGSDFKELLSDDFLAHFFFFGMQLSRPGSLAGCPVRSSVGSSAGPNLSFLWFSCDAAGLRQNPLSGLQLHGVSVWWVQRFRPGALLFSDGAPAEPPP